MEELATIIYLLSSEPKCPNVTDAPCYFLGPQMGMQGPGWFPSPSAKQYCFVNHAATDSWAIVRFPRPHEAEVTLGPGVRPCAEKGPRTS